MTVVKTTTTKERLLARILRDTLRREPRCESVADLRDVFRRRCLDLNVRYSQCAMERAFDLVGSNSRLVAAPRGVPPVRMAEQALAPRPLTRTEAATICGRLRAGAQA